MTETIFFSQSEDIEMEKASINARKSFKILWRELSWEIRRVIPAIDLSAVKKAFPTNQNQKSNLSVEHIWVGDIAFDGQLITGQLLNQPNDIENLNQGETVKFHYEEISDWMYLISDKAYEAFTVNVLRSRMTKTELREHDDAWGRDYGDPKKLQIEPMLSFDKFLVIPSIELPEYQMSQNMANKSEEGIKAMGRRINDPLIFGMTMLQFESLAGNLA